jgi:putative oxidoreductase
LLVRPPALRDKLRRLNNAKTAIIEQRGKDVLMNQASLQTWTPRMLSVLRIMAALVFLQDGLSKYFGFPAHPPANFNMFSLLGLAGAIELVGSLFMLVGLFSREAAFIMSGEIAVAYFMRHAPTSFFPQVNGGGLEVLICFVFLFLFFAGPGPWSIDAARRPAAIGIGVRPPAM